MIFKKFVKKRQSVWKRAFSLSWPVAIEQSLNTLMRTVDIIITGLISPAAVAAVGLADLYAQISMRVGKALGAGSIALSSQDTGRGADNLVNRAVTQALIIGFLSGIPLVIFGIYFSYLAIEILGAESDVVTLGGVYLMIILSVAPMRISGLAGYKSLQGTGDTRTPMYINVVSNIINVFGSIFLGLGLFVFPTLGIIGVGVATAISRTIEFILIIVIIYSDFSDLQFTKPQSMVITKQLLKISIPNFAEGMSTSIAAFPFNALILTFGTNVNAAYHISRRIYQQIAAPSYRSFGVAASIIVGQLIGGSNMDDARFSGSSIVVFASIVQFILGCVIFVLAEPLVGFFTSDIDVVEYAVDFTRVYAISMVSFGIFTGYAGSLYGAGDTKTPFYARLVSEFVFMLSFSYVASIVLGFGLIGIYVGIALCYVCRAGIVAGGFLRGNWADKATDMMDERTKDSISET